MSSSEIFDNMPSSCDNLYLQHNKFFEINKDKTGIISMLYKSKAISKNINKNHILKSLNDRTIKLAQSYPSSHCIPYTPSYGLVIGTGAPSPYNTTLLMTLHQTYGFPYIPATAIKGCLRSYLEQENCTDVQIDKLLGSDSDSSRSKGCLVFFDTFPSKFNLTFDVMTPHNSTYYSSKGAVPPSDIGNKTPISFPFVKESTFNIYIANTDTTLDSNSMIASYLKKALKTYGLGAKTAYGYGLSR